MIKVENGVIKLNGPAFVLKAEFAALMMSMFEEKILTKEDVDRLAKLATMNEDELKKMAEENEKSLNKLKSSLHDILDLLNRGGEDGDTFSNMFKDLDI